MSLLNRLFERTQGMSAAASLRFIASRILRYESHVVFHHNLQDIEPPVWEDGDKVVVLHSRADVSEIVVADLLAASQDNKSYINDIHNGAAIGLLVYRGQTLAHFAFVMRGSKTLQMLGFNPETALLGNANTVTSYRGRGLQTRSVRARLIMAQEAGFRDAVSETAPDNYASQKAMRRAGLSCLGTVRFVVFMNRLVLRHTPFRKRTISFTIL